MEEKIYLIDLYFSSRGEGEIPFSGPHLMDSIRKAVMSSDPIMARAAELNEISVYPFMPKEGWRSWCRYQGMHVSNGERFQSKVVIFSGEVFNVVRSWLLKRPSIRIGEINFLLNDVSWTELNYSSFIIKEPSKSFRLVFMTPTCLKRSEPQLCYLYPNMRTIISSLASIWNRRADIKCPDPRTMGTWASLSLIETGYELCTSRPIQLQGNRYLVGFVGWVNYRVADHPEWRKEDHSMMAAWAQTLLRLGELSGVGIARSIGFGKIRYSASRSDTRFLENLP